MARQIILLDRRPSGWPGSHAIRAVFWIPVTPGQEFPPFAFVSAVKGPDQPNTDELAALVAGAVVEYQVAYNFPSNYSLANARTFLEACYAQAVAAFASATTFGAPGQFYGMTWDGTTWAS